MNKIIIVSQIIAILILSWFTRESFSQGYDIELIYTSKTESIHTLSYYYGMRQIYVDTAKVINDTTYQFRNDSMLSQGLYLIHQGEDVYMELLIADDQTFVIHTQPSFKVQDTQITGADETSGFIEYQKYMQLMDQRKTKLRILKKVYSMIEDSVNQYDKDIDDINSEIKNAWKSIIENNPNSLLAKTILLFVQPEIPDFTGLASGTNQDSLKWLLSLQFYRNHYLDHTTFNDERLLNIPFFQEKVFTYLTKIIEQNPDSIIFSIDEILNKAIENEIVYKYLISNFLRYYETAANNISDEVFIHLVDNYYLQGKTSWITLNEQKMLDSKSLRKKNTLYGRPVALPQLYDNNEDKIIINNIDAERIVLMFWSSDCELCTNELKKLYKMMDLFNGFTIVLTLSFDIDKEKWEKLVAKYPENMIHANVWKDRNVIENSFEIRNLPKYIVLDENKNVTYKPLNFNQLEKFLME
ncbi:MAG: DUF5106 domain-containing protein [Bacteroidales bacterium]|nr:DUF5106 domain-containing protein [Bacteroidales bacterium]